MKALLTSLVLLVCLSLPAQAQSKQISPAEAKKQADAVATRFNEAWNTHNAAALAKLFAPDAVFVLPTAKVLKGPEEVKQFYAAFLDGPGKNLTHKAVVDAVRVVGPTSVWAIGHTTITTEGKIVGKSHWGAVYRVTGGHMLAEMLNVGTDVKPPPTASAQK